MKKPYRAITAVALFSCFFSFMPEIAVGQDSLNHRETLPDSTIGSIISASDTVLVKTAIIKSKKDPAGINCWGTAGIFLIGGFGDLNISKGFSVLTLHAVSNEGKPFNFDSPREPESKEYGLLYGVILTDRKKILNLSISAGVSRMFFKEWVYMGSVTDYYWLTGSTTNTTYEERHSTIYGYPVKVGMMFHGTHFGLGMDILLNHNSIEDYYKFSPHISIGKFR